MARTKSSVGSKVAVSKSSKARVTASATPVAASPGGSGGRKKSTRDYSSGNPVCPRETPKWQKPISNFLIIKNKENDDGEPPGTSDAVKTSKRINVIMSDDEDEDAPRNSVLDESFDLEPLSGDKCHKLQEYYNKRKGGRSKTDADEENYIDNGDAENDIDNGDAENDIDNVDEENADNDTVDEENVACNKVDSDDKENRSNGRMKRDLDSSDDEGTPDNKKVRVDVH